MPVVSSCVPAVGSILDSKVNPKYTLSAHLWNYLKEYEKARPVTGSDILFGPDDVAGRHATTRTNPREGSEATDPEGMCTPDVSRSPGSRSSGFPTLPSVPVVVPVVRAVARLMKPHIVEVLAQEGRVPPSVRQAEILFEEPVIPG